MAKTLMFSSDILLTGYFFISIRLKQFFFQSSIIPTSPTIDNATEKSAAPASNYISSSKANGSSVDEVSKDSVSEKDMTLMQLHKDGALQQCITELSTNLRRCNSELPDIEHPDVNNDDTKTATTTTTTTALQASAPLASSTNFTNKRNSHSDNNKVTASHFVTVIEVKEGSLNNVSPVNSGGGDVSNSAATVIRDSEPEQSDAVGVAEKMDKFISLPLAAVLEAKKKVPPR